MIILTKVKISLRLGLSKIIGPFSMEGIPAVYFQNLVGSDNDILKFKPNQLDRSTEKIDFTTLTKLEKSSSINSKIYAFDKVDCIRNNLLFILTQLSLHYS